MHSTECPTGLCLGKLCAAEAFMFSLYLNVPCQWRRHRMILYRTRDMVVQVLWSFFSLTANNMYCASSASVFLAHVLLAASAAYSTDCRWLIAVWMDVCLCVVKLFSNRYSYIFSNETWHTWSTCQYAQNCGKDLWNFAFIIFGEFWKFFFESPLLQFFSDSHETWHTWSMRQYAKKLWNIFFDILIKIFWRIFNKFYINSRAV